MCLCWLPEIMKLKGDQQLKVQELRSFETWHEYQQSAQARLLLQIRCGALQVDQVSK